MDRELQRGRLLTRRHGLVQATNDDWPIYHVSELAAVGTVVNRVGSDRFCGEQLTARHGGMVGLPRYAFEYTRAGESAVVGAPGLSLWSNKNQCFRRSAIDPRGERTDWLWVRPDISAQAATRNCESVSDHPESPFGFAVGRASSETQLRLRLMIAAAKRGSGDPLAFDEAVITLFADLVDEAFSVQGHKQPSRESTRRAYRDSVNEAVRLIAEDPAKRWTLGDLAQRVHVAPLHFCRVFRRFTGSTIRDFQRQLRVACALDILEGGGVTSAQAATMAGFSSDSHLSDAMMAVAGVRPGTVARMLDGRDPEALRSLMDNRGPGRL